MAIEIKMLMVDERTITLILSDIFDAPFIAVTYRSHIFITSEHHFCSKRQQKTIDSDEKENDLEGLRFDSRISGEITFNNSFGVVFDGNAFLIRYQKNGLPRRKRQGIQHKMTDNSLASKKDLIGIARTSIKVLDSYSSVRSLKF